MTPQQKSRTRRSMLFVPGSNAAMLSNSFIYKADALMFDLEDSVTLREKDTARRLVYHALQHPLYQDIETIVRVNALDSAFGVADLEPSFAVAPILFACQKPILRKTLLILKMKFYVLKKVVVVRKAVLDY